MLPLSVSQLVEDGATYSNSDVEVVGWVVDRFEHRAIYDTRDTTTTRYRHGIWLTGQLPERQTVRGDGPLHGLRVKVSGKFHCQPGGGAGHMNLWAAWIGVRSYEVIADNGELGASE